MDVITYEHNLSVVQLTLRVLRASLPDFKIFL